MQFDFAAELYADQELVEVEDDRGSRVTRIDLEAEVQLAVAVRVHAVDCGVRDGRGKSVAQVGNRNPVRRRGATDIQGRDQLLHRAHVGADIASDEGNVELGGLDRSIATRIDGIEQRVGLVEAGVEIDDREARLKAR